MGFENQNMLYLIYKEHLIMYKMFPNSYLLDQSSSKPLESAPISKSSEVETGPSTPPTSRTGSAAEVIGQQPVVALIDAVEEPIGTVDDHEDGDFIDDDFGLSIKREWEHLRQQQLRIEEEISNIQKEAVPLVEKPPPPYTPPALGTIHILREHLYKVKKDLRR